MTRPTRGPRRLQWRVLCALAVAAGLGAAGHHLLAEPGATSVGPTPRRDGPRADIAASLPDDAAAALSARFEQVAAAVAPSVVQVFVDVSANAVSPPPTAKGALEEFRHFFAPGEGPRNRSQGSGFVISAGGDVLTNAHVVGNADAVRVRLADGQEVRANVVGRDSDADLALCRIPAGMAPPLAWGDSATLRPGAIVFAVGNPFGLAGSVSQGIVSAVRRRHGGRAHEYLQTDAAVNRGNSGGPLVDLEGRVLGVNTWILAPGGGSVGVGFALPAHIAREVAATMTAGRRSAEAWLGILPAPPSAAGEPEGAEILRVWPDSPAAAGGLPDSAWIRACGDTPIGGPAALRAHLATRRPGERVTVATDRGRHTVTLGRRPARFDPAWRMPEAGAGTPDPGPLTAAQRTTLKAALTGRACPCPCGRTLQNCFGCSAAKADFTAGAALVRAGLAPDVARRRLDAPVPAWAWTDYTDPAGRALLRRLDRLERRYGGAFRARRRYFPADPPALDAWRESINAVEVARAAGRWRGAHAFLIAKDGPATAERIARLPDLLGLRPAEFEAAIAQSRFERQIRTDLTAAPQQYGVSASPSLQFAGDSPLQRIDIESLAHAIERRILEQSQ